MFSFVVNHLLGHIPVWIWPFTAGAGCGAYIIAGILQNFPNFKPWMIFIRPICILVTVLGIFMYGGAGVVAIYQAQILAKENEIKVAQQTSDDANIALGIVMSGQKTIVIQNKTEISKRIKKVQQQIDKDCSIIDAEAWELYNDAVYNRVTK
jgi:hypothetical protein